MSDQPPAQARESRAPTSWGAGDGDSSSVERGFAARPSGESRSASGVVVGVVLVNDSPVARAVTGAVVQAAGEFRLLGSAAGGLAGVAMVCDKRPALVLLDMHMPDINGVEVTRRIMRDCPTRILICSATIHRNAGFLFDALAAGALDFAHTPTLAAKAGSQVGRAELLSAGAELLHKMRLVLQLEPSARTPSLSRSRRPSGAAPVDWVSERRPDPQPGLPSAEIARHAHHGLITSLPPIVAIGCSTGGPSTLARLLRALPRALPAAVVVSQHIEADFTAGLAQWLSEEAGKPVCVARDGEPPLAGRVYIAAGGRRNLTLAAWGALRYEHSGDALYYPNIDRMMTSVGERLGQRACGVILTGLGDDGAAGLAVLAAAGGRVLVEDPQTAVIDGMPRAVLRRGLATHGQSPEDLALTIARWARGVA
ncbi:response regulator [Thiorhodococcus mannitoliphagus]|uniref:protein-glutamate methylesterase n=1 Tax=Thiorhodococcus mannitoliphagus TaxID=329406 RepID=A0A6P1DZL2_9GAMM|nr:chemotaxis protein CheB [Thiorhodococcus mannitoliphagus]NEX21602.1 response regulator [Thiorhodococcus mannitoliphagus]